MSYLQSTIIYGAKRSFCILSLLILLVLAVACSKSAAGSPKPPPGQIDDALVAHWKQSFTSTIEIETGPDGTPSIPSGEYIDWILMADGSYTQTYYNQSSLGCTIVVLGTKSGYWHVDDNSTLYLDETYYHLKATDDCNPVYNMDKNLSLSHIKYVYQVAADEYGNPNLHLATTSGDDVFYR